MMTLNDSPMEKMLDDEPLEYSVLDAAVTCQRVVGAPVRPLLQCLIMTMAWREGSGRKMGDRRLVPTMN